MASAPTSQVYCDFDGTITEEDTLVLLLDRFGRPLPDGRGWRVIEDDPHMPEREKLQAEMDLLQVEWSEALAFLRDKVRIRAGFDRFVRSLAKSGAPMRILSGGFVEIIEALLPAECRKRVRIHANSIQVEGKRWRVIPAGTPRIRGLCNHCKSHHLEEDRERVAVYIGDGSTDFCPALRAQRVYAIDSLMEHMKRQGREARPFRTFDGIGADLRKDPPARPR